MLLQDDHSTAAASRAAQFAKELFDANASAFYEVDGSFALSRYTLCDVPSEFHWRYVDHMNRFDPLHPRHAAGRAVAQLSQETRQGPVAETATFASFSVQCGVSDMIEFFFRRNGRIVAGLSVSWTCGHLMRDDAMGMARKVHDYLEFNLVRSLNEAGSVARYRLTPRELEVVELLCCGRTNREICECLNISLATVKTHLIHIFEKLGVETRSAAVALLSRPM